MPPFAIIFAPAVAIILFMGLALPFKVRLFLFSKMPPWAMTLIWGIIVRGTLKGVLGSYGMFLTDIILYPGMVWAKKRTLKQHELVKAGKIDPETMKPIGGYKYWVPRKIAEKVASA